VRFFLGEVEKGESKTKKKKFQWEITLGNLSLLFGVVHLGKQSEKRRTEKKKKKKTK
jgi:hypothetical protein